MSAQFRIRSPASLDPRNSFSFNLSVTTGTVSFGSFSGWFCSKRNAMNEMIEPKRLLNISSLIEFRHKFDFRMWCTTLIYIDGSIVNVIADVVVANGMFTFPTLTVKRNGLYLWQWRRFSPFHAARHPASHARPLPRPERGQGRINVLERSEHRSHVPLCLISRPMELKISTEMPSCSLLAAPRSAMPHNTSLRSAYPLMYAYITLKNRRCYLRSDDPRYKAILFVPAAAVCPSIPSAK